jgi:hypothetical protein
MSFSIALDGRAPPASAFRFPALDGFDFDGPFLESFNG